MGKHAPWWPYPAQTLALSEHVEVEVGQLLRTFNWFESHNRLDVAIALGNQRPVHSRHLWCTEPLATIGYARVSTQDQALDRQGDELMSAGADEVRSEVGSGKKGADRPAWDELLRNLRQGDILMVTELSRLGRSTSQLAVLADDLTDRGIALQILNLEIDTGTPGRKLGYSIIAAVAEMERALLIERTMSGLVASRARGRVGGRKPSLSPA